MLSIHRTDLAQKIQSRDIISPMHCLWSPKIEAALGCYPGTFQFNLCIFTFSRVPNLLLITLVLSYYRLYVTKILLCGGGGVTIATSTTQKQSKFLAKFSSFFSTNRWLRKKMKSFFIPESFREKIIVRNNLRNNPFPKKKFPILSVRWISPIGGNDSCGKIQPRSMCYKTLLYCNQ